MKETLEKRGWELIIERRHREREIGRVEIKKEQNISRKGKF